MQRIILAEFVKIKRSGSVIGIDIPIRLFDKSRKRVTPFYFRRF